MRPSSVKTTNQIRRLVDVLVGLLAISRVHGAEFLVIEPDDRKSGSRFIGEEFIRTMGYEFTVGDSPISVMPLGVRDWDGGVIGPTTRDSARPDLI